MNCHYSATRENQPHFASLFSLSLKFFFPYFSFFLFFSDERIDTASDTTVGIWVVVAVVAIVVALVIAFIIVVVRRRRRRRGGHHRLTESERGEGMGICLKSSY